MKPLLILILGCVPLAMLTVWSFVELASIRGQPAAQTTAGDWPAASALAKQALAEAQAEKPWMAALAEADLLTADRSADLPSAPAAGSLKAAGADWPQWSRAREMIGAVLEAERSAAGTSLSALQQAAAQLEALREKCRAAPPRGARRLLKIVDRRLGELKTQIARRELQAESAAVLTGARAALRPSQYHECVTLCDQLLSKYAQVIDAATAEKVGVLRSRAQFWAGAEQLEAQLKTAETLERRRALLRAFLEKYPDSGMPTSGQQQALERLGQDLRRVEEQLAAAERSRAGTLLIEQLEQDLPETFSERLARAVEILDRYPEDTVKARLRSDVRDWLGEVLPEKQIQEPLLLREAETRQGEIVRGFFKVVIRPDGSIAGYQRYPTLEQLRNPVSAVGTYPKELLLAEPAESVPRRCVTRYNDARSRLLARPQRKQSWIELAELCRQLHRLESQYRQKAGSSSEEISFVEEGRFAGQLVESSAWPQMQKLFGP